MVKGVRQTIHGSNHQKTSHNIMTNSISSLFDRLKQPEIHPVLAAGIILFVCFFLAYSATGMLAMGTFDTHEFYGGDHWEWLEQNWEQYHKGSHPLLMLFLKPVVTLVDLFPALQGYEFAVFLNSGFAALAVTLAFLCFWHLSQQIAHSVVVALLYGCTSGQVMFGAIPESRMIEATVIIGTYVVLARSFSISRIRFMPWIAAGLLTFGVTITHFFQTLAAFVGAAHSHGCQYKGRLLFRYGALLVACALVLMALQKVVVPESKMFFQTSTIEREMRFSVFEKSFNSRGVVSELIRQFGFHNILMPRLWVGEARPLNVSTEVSAEIKTEDYIPVKPFKSDYTLIGMAGICIWVSLVLYGIFRNVKRYSVSPKRRTTILVTAAAILFTMVLHSLYGFSEMFLYICSNTFPILLFVIDPEFRSRMYTLSIATLAIIAGFNNWQQFLAVVLGG